MPDCVVVGAGVFGSWAALRLRQTGRSVALVEAFGPANPKSSSGGASRIIRMGYGSDEIYTRWAMRSLARWKDLFARANRPDLFQRTGVLWTARPGHPHAEGTLAAFRKLGVPHETLTADQVRQRYPELRFDYPVIGVFEPESGALLAGSAVRAVAAEARMAGVTEMSASVIPPNEEKRLEHIETEDGRKIAAETFIFACGPWLPKLFPQAVGRRIRVTRQTVFYLDAGELSRPIWIDFSDPQGPYTLPPMAGKGLKLALDQHGTEFDPDTGSRVAGNADLAVARLFLAGRCPTIAAAPLLEAEVCQYESTSSGDFLIDRHPSMSNVWLAGGGSGHGFKHGPAVGEYVAYVVGGGAGEPRFSWSGKSETAARSVY